MSQTRRGSSCGWCLCSGPGSRRLPLHPRPGSAAGRALSRGDSHGKACGASGVRSALPAPLAPAPGVQRGSSPLRRLASPEMIPQATEQNRAFLEQELERVRQEAAQLLQQQKEQHAALQAALQAQLDATQGRLRDAETALAHERAQRSAEADANRAAAAQAELREGQLAAERCAHQRAMTTQG